MILKLNEYIRTNTGNILRYKGHDKDFIDEHLSISDGKTVEFLGVIELHSLDPAEIVKEGDLVNGEIVYSIGTFGLPFKTINLNNGEFLTSDKIVTIETPQGCKLVINNIPEGYPEIINKLYSEVRDLSKINGREYLYYALINKLNEMFLLKGIIQNDPKEFPFEQERVDEWINISNKNLADLKSIFSDILLYLKSLGYNIDRKD